jgi:hypothetical protein
MRVPEETTGLPARGRTLVAALRALGAEGLGPAWVLSLEVVGVWFSGGALDGAGWGGCRGAGVEQRGERLDAGDQPAGTGADVMPSASMAQMGNPGRARAAMGAWPAAPARW